MTTTLAVAIVGYLIIIFGLALWANRQVKTEEDYLVAGRRLPLSLSTATLLATWFGAGSLLTATDAVYADGLRVTALEPYGAGLCLILAGLFFARPLWEMQICTVSDLYRRRFGPRAEIASVLVTVPGYVGWIAVQLVALAGVIELFFDLPIAVGIPVIAGIAMLYTLLGGMWSVTLTDAVQMALVVPGVVALGYAVFTAEPGALQRTDPEALVLVPRDSLARFVGWLGVLAVSALGNLPGQDLTQRIFAARSQTVARRACLLSGALYIALGTVPALLGLVARTVLPAHTGHSVLPALALQFLSPSLLVVFTLALISVVLSTLDSAILAPAATLARNGLRPYVSSRVSSVRLCQICVALVTVASVLVAWAGENAYSLLEESYAVGLVGLFVPFAIAVFAREWHERSALVAMATGMLIWVGQFLVETTLPVDLIATLASLAAYYGHAAFLARHRGSCP